MTKEGIKLSKADLLPREREDLWQIHIHEAINPFVFDFYSINYNKYIGISISKRVCVFRKDNHKLPVCTDVELPDVEKTIEELESNPTITILLYGFDVTGNVISTVSVKCLNPKLIKHTTSVDIVLDVLEINRIR